MEIENEFMMSQDGYASIDFTLLDRPNNKIASAPEATAVLLPDEHATDSSFPSFDLLDGLGVVGSYGYAGEGEDNQALEQSRDGSEKEFYKEQAVHSSPDNGVGGSNAEYGEYQMSQSVPKSVSSVAFFSKNQAPHQQMQQSQLNLFGSDGGEANQEFFESGQASQQSQATGSSWGMSDNSWAANNNQRGQSQVYNLAAMTEEQRSSMRLRIGGAQSGSEYPGAMYIMPQVVNSDPTPSMYSFLPMNTHQLHHTPKQADAARVEALQSSSAGKYPQYDFPGLLNGSGYQQGGNVAQNMSLMEQQRYRAMTQEANGREQQIRIQEVRNREQQLRMREGSSRGEQQQLRQQQQLREQQLREHQAREQQLREQQLRLQELNSREKQLQMQEAGSREQQLRLLRQQNQSCSNCDNQSMEVSPLKVSNYDFLGGGDYTVKGQCQPEVRQQLNEGDAQLWRQQQQLAARQQPPQFNPRGNNSYEGIHQRQHAQVRQRVQYQAQQQQLLGRNQSQASGNQFQAFLGEGSLQDLPQVMQQQPERVNSSQTSADGLNAFVPPNVQAVDQNQNRARSLMYNLQNEGGAGQGPINYLLGQDNSFSWHQLAMKASDLDQPMYASVANSGKAGQQYNPYANAQGGAMPGFLGGMGKHPNLAGQINRPIPRSLGAGPSSLLGMDARADGQNHQASKVRMLFGHAMPQQQQQLPSQAAKHMQGFIGHSQQGNYMAGSRQTLEEAHRRHGLNLRGNAVQQDGAPHVKLFAQSLTSMDPIQQQQQQQQQHLRAASRNAQNPQSRHASIVQQSALNMAQEGNSQLGASPGQQGVNQAGGSFLHNAADRNQQPMWNNYEVEAASQVEVPVMVPGNGGSLRKGNSWSGESEGHPVPECDNSSAFERSRMQQQNVWGVHGVQPSNSQSSGDIGLGQHNTQSGSVVQQGTPKSTVGDPLDTQANGGLIHQSPLQPGAPMLDLLEIEANGRQQELQNSQEETNWRNHSLLQASPQQAAGSKAFLQAFTETARAQTSWKSLWQSVQNPGNVGQLGEAEKGPQHTLWEQNNPHVAGPQPELSDESKASMALNGWDGGQGDMQADVGGESHQGTRMEQLVMVSGSPQAALGFQDVEGRQQLSNRGPSFQEALSQASLSDNDPSSTSQHVDQSLQNATSFAQPVDRGGSAVNSSDPGGHSSSSKEAMYYFHYSVEQQISLNKGNLQNQGKMNAWTAETRERFDNASVPVVDSSGQREGRVQLQLTNQRVDKRLSSLMSARGNMAEEFPGAQPVRAMNAASGYGHLSNNGRPGMLNGVVEGSMAGWAHGQMGANQMRFQQSILAGRGLQTNNVAGNAGKEAFLPSRPERAGDEQSSYTNSVLAQRARYSGRRDVADPERNTLELLHQSEQGEEIADALVDQEGSAAVDGAGPYATSLAHLRPGHVGGFLLQRPTPSRAEFASREQMEPQFARNVESWPQGRNLQQEFTKVDGRVYAQAQMQAHNMQAVQLQGENMARPGLMQERVGMDPAFLGANRHSPSDMSRQTAANIYKNLSEAAKIQFRQQLHQQQLANQQRARESQRASVGGHPMDLANMSGGMDPRVGYLERPEMTAGMFPDKQSAGSEIGAGPPGQGDVGSPQAQPGASQQSQQPAPAAPIVKKRKEFPPLVPWRTTISQGSTKLPTKSRAEMEWAGATNSNPDQERFNDAVVTLDVMAMCVKRAKRRLKFTTQLMQQLVPPLPCQLFKGTGLDDYKSATFVLAKFAVSEACWLSTGLSGGGSGTVAVEGSAEMSNGDDSTVHCDQQVAVMKQGSPLTLSSRLRRQVQQKMTQLQDELSRLESAPTASKLSRELHGLDKMVVLNRMARAHGSEFLGGLSNPSESPRGKLESHGEAPVVYSPENAYPERFVAAVFVPQTIPVNLMLFPL